MKTLTLYRRVSHDMQTGEDKDGLKRQERSFKKFLSSFPDLAAYKQEEISDEGLSAYHGVNVSDKGGLGLYLKRVTSGEIERGSMLVCEEQSRLTRLPHRVALRMLWELEDHGIIIWSIKDNRAISGDDFSNDIMTMLNAKGAHDYSAEIARKVGDAKRAQQKAARIDKTGHLGMVCPYWLKPLGKGKFEPIPEHVTTIKRIFAERFQLRSMAAIAAGLNADNRPLITSRNWKKRAAPTGWTQSMVKNLLNNPRVMGTLPESDRKGSVYPEVKGYYGDPIVPLEHWLAAQESLSQKGKKAVRNDANPFSVRLFKSLIICKFCGHKMDVNGARGALSERGTPYHGSLICRNARENSCMHGVNHSRTPALPMKLVEHALTTNLFRDLKQRDVSAGAQERIAQLSLEVIELEQAIQQNTNDLATIRNQNESPRII